MTLICKWVKDPAGGLVMKWTRDEAPMPEPLNTAASRRNPGTRNHQPRATGLVLGAMFPAWLIPKPPAAETAPKLRAQATPLA